MALASSSRNGARIIWVALHTAEGSRRRSDLYHFFDTVRSGSSHGAADGTGLDDGWVPDDRAAWTLLNGNPVSLNLEMCAFARWTRAQWLSTGTVDGVVNPRQMVRNAAEWARRKCEKHGIPKTHIGADGVAARRPGIIMHRDYTVGARDGDHTDIGDNFPWDVFFADMAGTTLEDDMPLTADDVKLLLYGTPVRGTANLAQVLIAIDDNAGQAHLKIIGVQRQVAAIAANPDVTPAELERITHEAVSAASREQTAQIVTELRGEVSSLVQEALERVQDADNLDEARATVDELLRRLAALKPEGEVA
jgi:hypothetical protein